MSPRAAAVVLVVVLTPAIAWGGDEAPPNVVLVTLDTTRADRLGCYGSRGGQSPNIDAVAAGGVRFEHVQSPAPLTVPAHASLMTGLVPQRHGARDNAVHLLPAYVPVLAELLAERGFDTAAFVSSVVLDRRAGLARGFRIYDDTVRVGRREAFNYEERAASQTNAAVFARLADLDPPFLLWVHYFDPHLPYVPPPPYDDRFADSPYDGEIAFMDAEIGRLLDRVRAEHPRSLVVVTADHGESLGEHGESAHGVFLYQATQRVPLIVAGPGIPAGRTVEPRVGLVDVTPTILDLLGVAPPPDLDGRSLGPLLTSEPPEWPVAAYAMESVHPALAYDWAPLRGVVRGDLVAIDAPRPEVYDLAHDPGQRSNLGITTRHGRALMDELRRTAGDDALGARIEDADTAERRMRLAALGYASGSSGDAALDPKDGIALLAVLDDARAAVQHGRPAEAIEPLRRVLARNPGNVPARLTLVAALLARGDATVAVAEARTALVRRPGDDLVHFNLANALRAESASRPAATEEAVHHYEEALRINPRRAGAYLNYASLLVALGRATEARQVLARAEDADVADPDIAVERALLELLRGRPADAARHFEEALRLNPYDADVRAALDRLRSTADTAESPVERP